MESSNVQLVVFQNHVEVISLYVDVNLGERLSQAVVLKHAYDMRQFLESSSLRQD